MRLVEGPSAEWIPKMKEHFGVKSFDLVFLDHWKEQYLPDTKLMEASLSCSFSVDDFRAVTTSYVSGVWPSQERHRAAGRQRHLSRSAWLLGICPQQPEIQEPVLQVSLGVHQSGGRVGEVRLLIVLYNKSVFYLENLSLTCLDIKSGVAGEGNSFVWRALFL